MNPQQLFALGRILGWVILTGFLLAALNPFFKQVNKKHMVKRPKDDPVRQRYQKFLRSYIKAHPYIGLVTGAVMLTHLAIQYRFYGFYVSGIVAGTLMLIQLGLGIFGQFIQKKKPGLWLKLHRLVSLLLILAVIFHIVQARTN